MVWENIPRFETAGARLIQIHVWFGSRDHFSNLAATALAVLLKLYREVICECSGRGATDGGSWPCVHTHRLQFKRDNLIPSTFNSWH